MKKILSIAAIASFTLIFSALTYAEGDLTRSTASSASVSGQVLDISSGETLAGVAVSVEGTNMKVYTDLDGYFTIEGIEPGTYNLILSMISYKNSLIENIKLQANEKEEMNLKLENE